MDSSVLPGAGWVAAGAMLAWGFTAVARRASPRREHRIYATGLVVASAIYVLFAAAGRHAEWLGIELAGMVLFSLFALPGGRNRAFLLAAGWTLHIAWDAAGHLVPSQPVVGAWYPLLCLGFDPVVAARALRLPDRPAERPPA